MVPYPSLYRIFLRVSAPGALEFRQNLSLFGDDNRFPVREYQGSVV
jgi:hypothetical protein